MTSLYRTDTRYISVLLLGEWNHSGDLRLVARDPIHLVAVVHNDVSRRDAANILRMLMRWDVHQVGCDNSKPLRTILLAKLHIDEATFRKKEPNFVSEFLG